MKFKFNFSSLTLITRSKCEILRKLKVNYRIINFIDSEFTSNNNEFGLVTINKEPNYITQ